VKKGYTASYDFVGRYKQSRTVPGRGVRHINERDGAGKQYEFWVATIMSEGVMRVAKFSVNKYGEKAQELATNLRQTWMQELVERKQSTNLKHHG
jgi:hypothetical protein